MNPLMAIAFRTLEAVFVDDIETAESAAVHLAYERELFKHRALIHAPIYWNGQLYGIGEPCVFQEARAWTEFNQAIIGSVQTRLAPLTFQYLNQQKLLA